VSDNCSTGLTATGTVGAETGSGCSYSTTKSWTVTDNCGNIGTASQTVTYTRDTEFPVISSLTSPGGGLFALGTTATVTATFSDNCSVQSVVFGWDAEDLSPTSPTTTVNDPTSPTTGSYTYAAAGVYTVKVTVTDACGNSVSQPFQYVVIYEPRAGFVTGGGWIISPVGAYVASPLLTGKANFGFTSQYKKGATIPTGETEFQFQMASFKFHSTVYQWLVVSGARAQYKGTGTINGVGTFGFILTAIDGQLTGGGGTDKFRIKITDTLGAIVYDNLLNAPDSTDPTAIGGGSIVIHTK
jgi:PKD domain